MPIADQNVFNAYMEDMKAETKTVFQSTFLKSFSLKDEGSYWGVSLPEPLGRRLFHRSVFRHWVTVKGKLNAVVCNVKSATEAKPFLCRAHRCFMYDGFCRKCFEDSTIALEFVKGVWQVPQRLTDIYGAFPALSSALVEIDNNFNPEIAKLRQGFGPVHPKTVETEKAHKSARNEVVRKSIELFDMARETFAGGHEDASPYVEAFCLCCQTNQPEAREAFCTNWFPVKFKTPTGTEKKLECEPRKLYAPKSIITKVIIGYGIGKVPTLHSDFEHEARVLCFDAIATGQDREYDRPDVDDSYGKGAAAVIGPNWKDVLAQCLPIDLIVEPESQLEVAEKLGFTLNNHEKAIDVPKIERKGKDDETHTGPGQQSSGQEEGRKRWGDDKKPSTPAQQPSAASSQTQSADSGAAPYNPLDAPAATAPAAATAPSVESGASGDKPMTVPPVGVNPLTAVNKLLKDLKIQKPEEKKG